MWVIDLLMLTFVILFVIDVSGFVDSVKGLIGRVIGFRGEFDLKPFDCSLCMTFWVGLAYIYFVGKFTILGIFVVSMFSLLTQRLLELLVALLDLLGVLINKIVEYASKV